MIKNIFCFFISASTHFCYAGTGTGAGRDFHLSNHLQLVVVTVKSWEDIQGTMECFERADQDETWTAVGVETPVVLGECGMAPGMGLYRLDCMEATGFSKNEGDLKSPSGIFSLGCAFGFLPPSQMTHVKMDYLQLHDGSVAVDDPLSKYYNSIVDSREVECDWKSGEKMREEPLYEIGLQINHNWPQREKGKGSAIFFHRWHHPRVGTAGCTAMSQEDLENLLSWLEKSKNPLLVQLPYFIYSKLQSDWKFPPLSPITAAGLIKSSCVH